MILKVSISYLMSIIAFFVFLEPSLMGVFFPIFHKIIIILKVFVLVFAVFKFVNNRLQINVYFFLFVLYYLVLGISTFINGGGLHTWFYSMYNQVGAVMFVMFGLENGEREEIIKSFLLVVVLYLFFNTLVGEKNSTYLLGVRTAIPRFIIPSMGLVLAYRKELNQIWYKFFSIILVYFCIYYVFSEWVSTALAQLIFGIISYIAYKVWPNLKNKNIVISIGLIAFNFAVVVFGLTSSMGWFIQTILKKNLTFTGRTYIWQKAVESFLNSPIIGNGVATSTYALGITYAHTQFLNTLSNGGIVCFAILLFLILSAQRKLEKGDYNIRNLTLSVTMIALLIGSISEATFDVTNSIILLFFVLVDSYNFSDEKNLKGEELYNALNVR